MVIQLYLHHLINIIPKSIIKDNPNVIPIYQTELWPALKTSKSVLWLPAIVRNPPSTFNALRARYYRVVFRFIRLIRKDFSFFICYHRWCRATFGHKYLSSRSFEKQSEKMCEIVEWTGRQIWELQLWSKNNLSEIRRME